MIGSGRGCDKVLKDEADKTARQLYEERSEKWISIPQKDGVVFLYKDGVYFQKFDTMEKWFEWMITNQDQIREESNAAPP